MKSVSVVTCILVWAYAFQIPYPPGLYIEEKKYAICCRSEGNVTISHMFTNKLKPTKGSTTMFEV
jgi:hypothetical protein